MIRVNGGFQSTTKPFSPNPWLFRRIRKNDRFGKLPIDAKLLILEYLAFGPVSLVNRQKIYHEYIPVGSKFTINIIIRKPTVPTEEILEAMNLLSIFGGLGSRSRNGFGRFNLGLPPGFDKPDFLSTIRSCKNKAPSPYTSLSSKTSLWDLTISNEYDNNWNNVLFDLGVAWLGSRVNYDDGDKLTSNGIENEHVFRKRVFLSAPLNGDNNQQDLYYNGKRLKLDRHSKSHFFGLRKNNEVIEGYMLHLPYLFLENSNWDKGFRRLKTHDIKQLQVEYENVYKEFNTKLPLHSLTPVTI